jgi:hypothetical protein
MRQKRKKYFFDARRLRALSKFCSSSYVAPLPMRG